MVRNNLGNLLRSAGLAALGFVLPLNLEAFQDGLNINNNYQGSGNGQVQLVHYDGLSTNDDVVYNDPPFTTFGTKITSLLEGIELQTDYRPTNSVSSYNILLSFFNKDTSININGLNELPITFTDSPDFDQGPDPKRIYLGKAEIPGRNTSNGLNYAEVRNLRDFAGTPGVYSNWPLTNIKFTIPASPNPGVVSTNKDYGTLTVREPFLDTSKENNRITDLRITGGTNADLVTRAQLGTYIVDEVQVSTNLNNAWNLLPSKSFTNYVDTTGTNNIQYFNEGWKPIERQIDTSNYTNRPNLYFRIGRTAGTTNFANGASFNPI